MLGGIALGIAFVLLAMLRWTSWRAQPATFNRFLLCLNLLHYAWWDVRWAAGIAAYAAVIHMLARLSYRHRLSPLKPYDLKPLILLPVPLSIVGLIVAAHAMGHTPGVPWDFNPAQWYEVGLTIHVLSLLAYLLSVQRSSAVPAEGFTRFLAHSTFAGNFLAGPIWSVSREAKSSNDVAGVAIRIGGISLLRAAIQWGVVAILSRTFDGAFIALRHGEMVVEWGWAVVGSAMQFVLMWRAAVDTGHGSAVLLGIIEPKRMEPGRGFWPAWVDRWVGVIEFDWRKPIVKTGLLFVLLGFRWGGLALAIALVVCDALVSRQKWIRALAYPVLALFILIYRSDDWSRAEAGLQLIFDGGQWPVPGVDAAWALGLGGLALLSARLSAQRYELPSN